MNSADWHLLASALRLGLEPGALPAEHIVSRILVDERQRKSTTVHYVSSELLEFEGPSAATVLDAHLQSIVSSATS